MDKEDKTNYKSLCSYSSQDDDKSDDDLTGVHDDDDYVPHCYRGLVADP